VYYNPGFVEGHAMLITVRLDRETLRLMQRLARRTGRTKSEIIRAAIRRLWEIDCAGASGRTAYDAMKHSIGCCDSGGARLSERTGEKFRRLLIARQRSVIPTKPKRARRA